MKKFLNPLTGIILLILFGLGLAYGQSIFNKTSDKSTNTTKEFDNSAPNTQSTIQEGLQSVSSSNSDKNTNTSNDVNDELGKFDDTMKDYNLIFGFRDKLLDALKNGNTDAIISLMDKSIVENTDSSLLKNSLQNSAIPFFKDYQKLASQAQGLFPAPYYDNTPGYSLYLSLVNKEGETKPFVLTMVKRDDHLFLTDIFLNKTYEDLHNGQHPGE